MCFCAHPATAAGAKQPTTNTRIDIVPDQPGSMQCGTSTCTSDQRCCLNTHCYNPEAGESCCLPAKTSEYGNPIICAAGETCCGENIAMTVACVNPLNQTCCTANDPFAMSRSCPLSDTCCMVFGPPTMFDCCGGEKRTSCCSNGEAGASTVATCCAEHTTCCVAEEGSFVMCCNATERCDPTGDGCVHNV